MMMTKAELEKEFGSERAVQLCDGRTGLRGGISVKIETPSDAGELPIVEFTASNDRLDRYDETIVAAGWQLDNYKKNPVFQNSHKYGDIIFTLGKSILTEIRGNALVQRIQFAVDINPIARLAYDMYRQKFLNAVSVGFIPIRWETGSDQSAYRRKYLEQELLELSAVSIPANPDALQNAVKSGAVSKDNLRDLVEFLKEFCGDSASPESQARPAGSETNAGQLLQFQQHIARFLKKA
jgi:HK97 family phage prohead protease